MRDTAIKAAIITGIFGILAAIVAGIFSLFPKLPVGDSPDPKATSESPNTQVSAQFFDDFSNDAKSDWKSTGEWRTVNEKYTITNTRSQWAYSMVGDTSWQDYTVEADYTISNSRGIMIIVRAGSSGNLGLAYFVSECDHAWQILKDGDWTDLARENTSCATEGHIKVQVVGGKFTGYLNGVTQLTLTDKNTTSGQVGIGIYCYNDSNCATFDNFTVSSP